MVAALIGVFKSVPPDDHSRRDAAILERIKPIASANFEAPKPAGAVKLSGKEAYDKVCVTCHGAGVLGAPKTDDKAQWETRFAQGLDMLINHAINGLRAMPPRGGDPSLSDDTIKEAVAYMLGESGIKTEAAASAPAATPAAESAPAAPAPAAATPEPAAAPAAPAPAAPAPEPATTPAAPAAPPASVPETSAPAESAPAAPAPATQPDAAAPASDAPAVPEPPAQTPQPAPPAATQSVPPQGQ